MPGLNIQAKYSSVNITSNTTTVVKSSPGVLGRIVINKGVDASTITIYDNTAASGTKLATITMNGTGPGTLTYEVAFSIGLTIVTAGSPDLTVVYH